MSNFKKSNKNNLKKEEVITHLNKIIEFENEKTEFFSMRCAFYISYIISSKKHESKKDCKNFIYHLFKKMVEIQKTDFSFSSYSLISLLRSTYIFKKYIKQWDEMIELTKQQIIKEGLNPNIELYGLI